MLGTRSGSSNFMLPGLSAQTIILCFFIVHGLICVCCVVLWNRCSACQSLVGVFQTLASALQNDTGVEVGAVNCASQGSVCNDWFGVRCDMSSSLSLHTLSQQYCSHLIRGYPTILAVNDKHGTRQEYHGEKDLASMLHWARAVTREWRWLFTSSHLMHVASSAAFHAQVLSSTAFSVVCFLDGLHCSSCQTAKTNMMRLSASLQDFRHNVSVVIVNCEEPGE